MFARSSYSPLEAATTDAPGSTPPDDEWPTPRDALVQPPAHRLVEALAAGTAGDGGSICAARCGSSLQTGGEALTPRWLRRRRRAPRFVVLIDGSRSMSAYARTALQLAVALARAYRARRGVHVLDLAAACHRRCAAGGGGRDAPTSQGWSTRGAAARASAGACGEFVRTFGERLLSRDTVVIIASDGLDVGDPGALRETMATLRRRSAGDRLAESACSTRPGYEPTARRHERRPRVDHDVHERHRRRKPGPVAN